MDPQRFDELTRALAGTTSRRSLLTTIVAGAAAALALGRRIEHVAAKPPEDICQAKPGGKCTQTIPCCDDGLCETGHCGCSPGKVLCQGTCVKLQTNEEHCGACGHHCPLWASCSGGQCQCIADLTLCDGVCTDIRFDEAHCGGCRQRCKPGQDCVGGQCRCLSGWTECPDRCADLATDPANCGACGYRCERGESCCREGQCLALRPEGARCGTNADCCADNCSRGLCCPEGQTNCQGRCVNLETSVANCGACDQACVRDQLCHCGECVPETGETQPPCGYKPAPVQTLCVQDRDCPGRRQCIRGVCQPTR